MHRNKYKKAIEIAMNSKITSKTKSKNQKPFKYRKNATDIYDMLKKYGNQEQAIKWARELVNHHIGGNFSNHNPCTMVFRLVEELTGKSEKLIAEITDKYYEIG